MFYRFVRRNPSNVYSLYCVLDSHLFRKIPSKFEVKYQSTVNVSPFLEESSSGLTYNDVRAGHKKAFKK